ncbi:Uncharacterised protein [Mycobacteroides abscessus subsp. abscessus]|nr:Uncharacterised protein [Mycobacteroides abscessus subsp. abscessus]
MSAQIESRACLPCARAASSVELRTWETTSRHVPSARREDPPPRSAMRSSEPHMRPWTLGAAAISAALIVPNAVSMRAMTSRPPKTVRSEADSAFGSITVV